LVGGYCGENVKTAQGECWRVRMRRADRGVVRVGRDCGRSRFRDWGRTSPRLVQECQRATTICTCDTRVRKTTYLRDRQLEECLERILAPFHDVAPGVSPLRLFVGWWIVLYFGVGGVNMAVSVCIGAGGCSRGTAMSVGSIRVVSRCEIGMMYCLLSRPTHARSGVRLEIGCHLPGVRERAVSSSMTRFCFRGHMKIVGYYRLFH
jgi:hypothetical protein